MLIFERESAGYTVLNEAIVLREMIVLIDAGESAIYMLEKEASVLSETYVLNLDSGYRNVSVNENNVLCCPKEKSEYIRLDVLSVLNDVYVLIFSSG